MVQGTSLGSHSHIKENEMELKDLVPDIYKMLDTLNKGGSIEKDIYPHMALFLSEMEDAVIHWATPEDRTRKDGLRMSNIGKPDRQLYFDMRTDEAPKEDPSLQMKFLLGHVLEQVMLLLVRSSGHEVTRTQDEVNVEGIKGHMDSVIDGEVVDIKTASPYGFQKFVTGSIVEDDPFGYMAQIAGYEADNGTQNGGNLVINKVTGELTLFIPEDLDKPNIYQRIETVKEIQNLDSPPELCYPDVPEGKSGNMVINRKCNYCPHIEECRKDSNDGAGIRKFKYSNGTKYFTEVLKEPRVEEIL